MAKTDRETIFTRVPVMVKRKAQSIAIMNGIDFQDFISMALLNYLELLEYENIKIEDQIKKYQIK